MTFEECIDWIIKHDMEYEAVNLLNASAGTKMDILEHMFNEAMAGMMAARKINNAKYKDDAIDALLEE